MGYADHRSPPYDVVDRADWDPLAHLELEFDPPRIPALPDSDSLPPCAPSIDPLSARPLTTFGAGRLHR